MRKTDSTNSANERGLIVGCPMTYTASVLGRRWKPIILWKIREGVEVTADLQRAIPLISRKMLFQEIQSLLELGLISRQLRAGSARGARYRLTELGQSLVPVLQSMIEWGQAHRPLAAPGSPENPARSRRVSSEGETVPAGAPDSHCRNARAGNR